MKIYLFHLYSAIKSNGAVVYQAKKILVHQKYETIFFALKLYFFNIAIATLDFSLLQAIEKKNDNHKEQSRREKQSRYSKMKQRRLRVITLQVAMLKEKNYSAPKIISHFGCSNIILAYSILQCILHSVGTYWAESISIYSQLPNPLNQSFYMIKM